LPRKKVGGGVRDHFKPREGNCTAKKRVMLVRGSRSRAGEGKNWGGVEEKRPYSLDRLRRGKEATRPAHEEKGARTFASKMGGEFREGMSGWTVFTNRKW